MQTNLGVTRNPIQLHRSIFLGTPIDSIRKLPKAKKEPLSYLAGISTMALEVFLNPGFDFPTNGKGKAGDALLASVERLGDAMHLAFAAEVASSPGLRIWEEGWDVKLHITSTVKSGNMQAKLKTTYDSKKHIRKPDDVNRKHATLSRAGGRTARVKPSS